MVDKTAMSDSKTSLQVAVAQMTSRDDLHANLLKTKELTAQAVTKGASFVLFPECFCFLGQNEASKFAVAEEIKEDSPGPILSCLISLAVKYGIWISGAGIPEKIGESAYNSLVLVSPEGKLAAVYRKIHLFDVDLPGTRLCESDATVRGKDIKIAQTDFATLGLSTCYDLRFPELYRHMVSKLQANILLVPAAFTAKTGLAHWHVLLRARAIENQCFVMAAGQTGQHNSKRSSYGHSIIVDPWGEIIAEIQEGEGIAIATLDFKSQQKLRLQMPCLSHRTL